MRILLSVASTLLLLSLLQCSGETLEPGSAGGTGGSGGAGGNADASSDVASEVAASGTGGSGGLTADEKYAWVCKDGGIKPTGQLRFSCCGGHVCLGTCEQGQCHCGGIIGGCDVPSLCCVFSEGVLVCGGEGVCKPLG